MNHPLELLQIVRESSLEEFLLKLVSGDNNLDEGEHYLQPLNPVNTSSYIYHNLDTKIKDKAA
jgi:hypothetical protein